jgi:hypothetical protein
MSFALNIAPLAGNNFCASSSSHTYKTLLIFSKKRPRIVKEASYSMQL